MEVHINQLPLKRNYVILNEEFHNKLFSKLLEISGTIANASRLTKISKSVLRRFFRKETKKIRIDFLLRIINSLDTHLKEVENKVIWIGSNQGQGIMNPKLPFSFNSRASARFLAAICNDGCITVGYRKGRRFSYGRLMYNNNEQSLRESVVKDAETIFGQSISKEFKNRGNFFLAFPSIMRDVVEVITQFKGEKSVNNPPIPSFILENKELILGWIEQTIADEGHVKHYPETYRREIVWRRSFNKGLDEYKLNKDEIKMLNVIGIKYDLKNIGTYKTKKSIEKTKLQIRISERKNLLRLRTLIKIPDKKKDDTFTEITQGFVRYKEPLRIKEVIIKLCETKGHVTSPELKKKMNYKNINSANKWIKYYLQQGLLKCIERTSPRKVGAGRIPAKYTLN